MIFIFFIWAGFARAFGAFGSVGVGSLPGVLRDIGLSRKVVGLGVASVGCCSFGSSVEFAECMGGGSSEGFRFSFSGFVARAPLFAGLLGRCSCAPRTSFWWCGVVVGVDSSWSGGHASPQAHAAKMKEAKGKKGASTVAKKDVKEKVTKVQDKDIKKRKGAVKEAKAKKPKPAKKAKDPNAPKRPPTAFFIFLNEFRTKFKEENPDVKGVTAVGKAGGEKWKAMSDAEKQPYMSKAVQKKSEYDKSLSAYKSKQDDDDEEPEAEESDKSKSEINDDDEEDEDEDEDLED